MRVSEFMETYFHHFNARETLAAAKAYRKHMDEGGQMFLAMAGAMSTGELGRSLARMIRAEKIQAISCTAANLEEDIYNLLMHDQYRTIPDYRDLTPEAEVALRDEGLNRVTDTCIPEQAFNILSEAFIDQCAQAAENGQRLLPYEHLYKVLDSGALYDYFSAPVEHSWVIAAWERRLPIYTPGFEDSTLGNIFTASVMKGRLPRHDIVRSGSEQLEHLAGWYEHAVQNGRVGFFQIGGGIAGDFSICVVPMLIQDLKRKETPLWGYFCQISDSTTSYGSYSGAVPNEKITWYKIDKETPRFMIQSDASIVAPLIFSYVMGE